jgi:hypothetical protein
MVSDKEVTKHKLRFGEEWYTICVTIDDWWLEDGPSDMSEKMMRAGEEFALENGMLPPKVLCSECRKGIYVDVVDDYTRAGVIIRNLDMNRCPNCRHTTLPWASAERVDKALEEARKAAKGLNGGKNDQIN